MTKSFLCIPLMLLLNACDSDDRQVQTSADSKPAASKLSVPLDKAALDGIATEAVQALGSTLKNELETAMKSGGPVHALEVCNVRAPVIAEEISWEQGVEVSRTSLKYRNPDNAPNEWQSKVLEDFEGKKSAGADPATLVYSEIVNDEYRFMKAIPAAGLCMTCHGTNISPELSTELTRLYPQDKATGYQEGDLRGAFVVIKYLNE